MAEIRTVGVVGAGTMGIGITQVCATNGFDTLLHDVDPEQVERALKAIEQSLDAGIAKGRLSASEKNQIVSRVQRITILTDLKADLIIEAAVERLDIKKDLLARLEKVNGGKAILATNTSSLSVSQVAEELSDPSKCIGLHFFNPADRMKLVEIISGKRTHPDVVVAVQRFSAAIGKTAVLAKDSPGFIVNRVARPFYAEALKAVADGKTTVPVVDHLLRASGFRMGPFELMDLIGVDTNLAVTTSVYEGLGRPLKFAPSALQQRLVNEGKTGRKSGRGFYEYEEKGK